MKPIDPDDRGGDGIDSRKHAGFDYRQAILELAKVMSEERIGFYMGYGAGKQSTVNTLKTQGQIPAHDKGEMLWALYIRIFGKKPPMSDTQRAGLDDDAFLRSVEENYKKRKRQNNG